MIKREVNPIKMFQILKLNKLRSLLESNAINFVQNNEGRWERRSFLQK